MTDYGMLRSRVPMSEIFLKEPTKDIPFHFKQLWDCFSENVTVVEYEFLKGKRVEVLLKDKTKIWATYLMTIDWFDNAYSDDLLQPRGSGKCHGFASDPSGPLHQFDPQDDGVRAQFRSAAY